MSAAVELTAPAVSERCFVFAAPYSRVIIPASDVEDHIGMRAEQLAAVLRVMPVADYSAQKIKLARRLANELVGARKRGDDGEVLAGQLAELLFATQGPEGPCDLLWLCEQIADELSELTQGSPDEE